MKFTEKQMQQTRTRLDEAYALSVNIYQAVKSDEYGNPINKQMRRLMSLLRKAQVDVSTSVDDTHVSAFKDLPIEESVAQPVLILKHFEDATAKDLSNYGIHSYVTNYPKPWDVLLSCDCDTEQEHYHLCNQFDWDRYLNNKRRFCPRTHIAE